MPNGHRWLVRSFMPSARFSIRHASRVAYFLLAPMLSQACSRSHIVVAIFSMCSLLTGSAAARPEVVLVADTAGGSSWSQATDARERTAADAVRATKMDFMPHRLAPSGPH